VRWEGGRGAVLAQFAGAEAHAQASEAVELLGQAVRVSGTQSQLADQMRAAETAGGSLVGRVAHGLSWIRLPEGGEPAAVERLRRELAPSPCVVLDAPHIVRDGVDAWGVAGDAPAVDLMRRVKERFDPAGTCNQYMFVGGI
jgi:glycolate oxidase FAD binding subunit